MQKKDDLFKNHNQVKSFDFNKEVVDVFDDMLLRSIPFYLEIQKSIINFCKYFYQKDTFIYDLGCSCGTTCFKIARELNNLSPKIIGIDNSIPMLNEAKERKNNNKFSDIEFIHEEIGCSLKLINPSIIILSLTLQFIKPSNRQEIINKIYNSLCPSGIVILYEKVIFHNPSMNSLFIDFYHNFKRENGYSDIEIDNKRIALESILIPFSVAQNISLLRDAGFVENGIFFQWFNFVGFIGQKAPLINY